MTRPIDACRAAPVPVRGPGLRALASAALERLFVWLTLARSRRALGELDDRALRDIGLDRATAAEEAARPFWHRF